MQIKGYVGPPNEIPDFIVEHYFILMSMEKEIWRKKLSLRNSENKS